MTHHDELSRRRFLRLAAVGAGAVAALAACGGQAAPASSTAAVTPASSAAAVGAASKPAASGAAATAASSKPAASGAAKPGSSAASGAQPSLKVAYVALAATQSPLWMANATGAFDQYKVKVDMQYIDSGVAVKALIAKEIDVIVQSASSVITADLNGGADLVYVGSGSNHSQGELNVAPSIKSAADLKGKLVGSDRPGTTTAYYTQVELKLLGLNESDLMIRPLGSTPTIYQALMSGQIQAGSMTPPQSLLAEAKGYPALQNTYSVPYQGSGPVISKGRMAELTPALVPFLAAYRQGMQAFVDQPDLAKKVIGEYTKTTDQEVLDRTYDFHRTSNPFQPDLKPTTEGIQAMLDFLSPTIPAAKTAKPEQFMDLSLLPQLPK